MRPDLNQFETRLDELRKQLARIEGGQKHFSENPATARLDHNTTDDEKKHIKAQISELESILISEGRHNAHRT